MQKCVRNLKNDNEILLVNRCIVLIKNIMLNSVCVIDIIIIKAFNLQGYCIEVSGIFLHNIIPLGGMPVEFNKMWYTSF